MLILNQYVYTFPESFHNVQYKHEKKFPKKFPSMHVIKSKGQLFKHFFQKNKNSLFGLL